MSDSIKLKIVKHYNENDTKFLGDVWYIRIYMNDELLREYGERAETIKVHGYLDALQDFFGDSEVVVTYENVADQE